MKIGKNTSHIVRETEDDFLSWVIDLAKVRQWKFYHTRAAWTNKGYRTPIQGDKGFPDLCLIRDNRLIFAEIKTITGKVSPEQYDWLEALGKAVPVYIWRPADRASIEEILA